MNIDMIPDGIDPEIDVRLTAMVLGEASDFEAAQLFELMRERPELAAWYEQLQHLHGELHQWALLEQHLAETTANEKIVEAGPWMLSPAKRTNLLTILGQGEIETPHQVSRVPFWQKLTNYRPKRSSLWIAVSVAASVVMVGSFLMLSSLQNARMHNWRDSAMAPQGRFDGGPAAANSIAPSAALRPSPSRIGTPSPSSSEEITRLYDTPNKNDFMQTITPQIVIADEAAAASQVPASQFPAAQFPAAQVPATGGGDALLGGVTEGPAAPLSPPVTGVPADSSDMLKSVESFGLASKPEEKSAAWALADGSESRYSEAESLRQQIESKQSELSSEAAKRKTSDSPFGFAQTPPVDSVAGDKLPRFAEQMPSSGADLGYLGDDPFGAEPSAPKPLSDVEGKESFGDSDPKPGMSEMGGLLGRGSNARGTSTADSKQQAQSDPKKTEVQRETNQLLAELSDKPQDSKWDMANRPASPDIALINPDAPPMETRGLSAKDRLLIEDFSIADENGTITPARKGRQRAQAQSLDKISDSQPHDVTVLPDLLLEGRDDASRSAESNEQEAAWYRDLGRTKNMMEDLMAGSAIAGKELERRHQLQKKQASPGLNEILTETERFSTFSLHVSDVSFKLALDSLAKGQWPEATKIRVEEFLNAFDYQDPLPSDEEKVACQVEQATHPFLMQRNLLRVAMRTSAVGRNSTTPLRLTLLLDNSGSMQRSDRAETVRRAFQTLAQQLNATDQVTLITFANEPKLRADRVKGDEVLNFVNILENSPVEGGTNLEAALRLALEKSLEAKTEGAQSRVILMTDGAVNLGDADPNNLSQLVLKMRDQGIAFDAAGISAQDLNDEVLEALARQGDGRYYLLDNAEQVDAGFSQQIAGALRPSAKNVKIQVEFNPQRVRSYKLLGFEKHILNKEDFRNDKVDAAELAAAEAGNALYHYEILPDGIGDVGSVSVRFQDMTTGVMVEKRWPIAYEPTTPRMDQATPSMKLATSAVLFAAHLKGEPIGESVELPTIAEILGSLQSPYSNVERVQQLRQMVESARQIAGASSGNR